MKRFTGAVIALATTFATMSMASPGFATTTSDPTSNLEVILAAPDPLVALDSLTADEKQAVFPLMKDESGKLLPELEQKIQASQTPEVTLFADGDFSSFWGAFERAACVVAADIASCNIAADDAATATSASVATYPSPQSQLGGRGDAYRHCYWNGLMTRHIGERAAALISNQHEVTNQSNTGDLAAMDRANNATGRSYALTASDDATVNTRCSTAAVSNLLVTTNGA